ncbi:MAG: hypothetical protein Ct9H90mP13_11720 [Pseudomonadota bacterium]|nr:MAG: hypothetical protein Ct9H90mP13_11720 [Pseudomonadota bacterium]
MKSLVNSILSKHTGKTEKQIAKDTDRDNFMDAKSALDYGLKFIRSLKKEVRL